jgi:hypothetical protein
MMGQKQELDDFSHGHENGLLRRTVEKTPVEEESQKRKLRFGYTRLL